VGGLSASLSWCYARQPPSTSDKDSSSRIDRLDGKGSSLRFDSAGNTHNWSKRGDTHSRKGMSMRKVRSRRSKGSYSQSKDSHSTRRSTAELQQREASRFRGRPRTRPTPQPQPPPRHPHLASAVPASTTVAAAAASTVATASLRNVARMLSSSSFQVSTRRSLIVGKAAPAEVAWVRPRSPPVGPLEWRNAEGTFGPTSIIQPGR
jgi:hypothetical protein